MGIIYLTLAPIYDIIMISKIYERICSSLNKEFKMEEKIVKGKNGFALIFVEVVLYIAVIAGCIFGFANAFDSTGDNIENPACFALGFACMVVAFVAWIPLAGLKVVRPQECYVFTLFGKYYGTLKGEGFYFVNPFVKAINPASGTKLNQSGDVNSDALAEVKVEVGDARKKLSLKIMTLSNSRQKINDCLGNPIEIGIAVTWRVVDTAKACFSVDNYKEYLSLQCDSALRDIVRLYPYDVAENIDTTGDGVPDEGSLRGSSELVAERIREKIQDKVQIAGLEVIEARITYLAYSPEIAAAMLQRQQAAAIIDARKMIVDGAVGMVEMALERLNKGGLVELDEERKAAMVSNLLVVLCGNKDAQPIVNSGSLY